MIILIALIVFCLAIFFCAAEAWYERDWPRDMGKFALYAFLILLFSMSAFGQNVRFDLPITTTQAQGGNLLPLYAIPGAGIKFYSCSGSTCTSLATTYISATSGTTCPISPTPMQVVLQGTTTCVSSADPFGNMGGWFQAGQYMATVTALGGSYNYYFTIGGGGGGSGSVTAVSVVTANGFQGTVANPTTTPAISVNVDSTHVLPVNTGATTNFLNQAGLYSVPASAALPVTTKGDLLGYSTVPARIPVGTDDFCLVANSTLSLGLGWAACPNFAVSGQASGVVPLATGENAIGAQSHINENTSGTTTVTQQFAINSTSTPSQETFTYNAGHPLIPGSSTSAVYGVNSAGLAVVSEAGATAVELCTVANGACNAFSVLNYGGNAGGTVDNSAAVTAACAANGQVYFPVGTYNFTSSYVIPCPEIFQVGAALKAPNAVTVTFNPSIQAFNYQQIAVTAGSGSFLGLTGLIPVQWFNPSGNATRAGAGAGADTSALTQLAINAVAGNGGVLFPQLCYNITSGISITTSNTSLVGTGVGLAPSGYTVPLSCFVTNSSPVNAITIHGTPSAYITDNSIQHFSLFRLSQPSGTVPTTGVGIYVQYAGGFSCNDVGSMDSLDGFYSNGTPGFGGHVWNNCFALNGGFSVNSYTTETLNGFDIDSTNGVAEDSISIQHSGQGLFNSASVSTTATAFNIHGTAINDVDLLYPTTGGGGSYCVKVVYSGTGAADTEADIHVDFPICDAVRISDILIDNVTSSSANAAPSVSISNGYLETGTADTKIVDIENSSGVQVLNNQIYNVGDQDGSTGVYINGGSNNSVVANRFQNLPAGYGVQLNNTSAYVVNSNTFFGNFSDGGPDTMLGALSAVGSEGGTVIGNNCSGYVTTCYAFDSGSLQADFVSTCAGSHIGTCQTGTLLGTAPAYFGDVYSNGALLTGGGSGISGLTSGYLPSAGSATTLTSNSHIDDGVTTPSILSSSESITVTTGNSVLCKFCDIYSSASSYNFGQGQAPAQVALYATSPSFANSVGMYLGTSVSSSYNNANFYFAVGGEAMRSGDVLCWSSSSSNAGTANTALSSLCDTGLSRDSAGNTDVGNGTPGDSTGTMHMATGDIAQVASNNVNSNTYSTGANCASATAPAVCGSAAAGSVLIPTGTTSSTLTVNTTVVTANSQIFFYPDDSLGTRLGVTCNSTLATLAGGSFISARTPGTSFTITFNGSILTNGVCGSFSILN